MLFSSTHTCRQGDFDTALTLSQGVLAVHPSRADILLLIGAIYYQQKNYEQCVAYNDRCILLCPTLAEAHTNLANALQQLGATDLAILYYQSALKLKPSFTDAYNNLAAALAAKGLVRQAMDCYTAALRINPLLPDVHTNLGDMWRAQVRGGQDGQDLGPFIPILVDDVGVV